MKGPSNNLVSVVSHLSVRDYVASLGFRKNREQDWIDDKGQPRLELFAWPPDLFAMAASVLRESGAYLQAARPMDLSKASKACLPYDVTVWIDACLKAASEWRRQYRISSEDSSSFPYDDPNHMPRCVVDLLHAISAAASGLDKPPLLMIELSRPCVSNLDWLPYLQLMCIADMACRGMGVVMPSLEAEDNGFDSVKSKGGDDFVPSSSCNLVFEGATLLQRSLAEGQENGKEATFTPSTLCKVVDSSMAVVIPKMRTSQRGATIRSFSLHLALINGADAEPRWYPNSHALLKSSRRREPVRFSSSEGAEDIAKCGPYNIILLPWPFAIDSTQFEPLDESPGCMGKRPLGPDRFFEFRHRELDHDRRDALCPEAIRELIKRAEAKVGPVHGLVLPEMALTKSQFDYLFPRTESYGLEFIVSGVYEKSEDPNSLGRNYAMIRRSGGNLDDEPLVTNHEQHKHHRWALDHSQVDMYSLSASLSPKAVWWEAINLERRSINFFALDSFTAFTALICEDLARPDPMADAIRAAGPNLVICLLMDGPQLATRWSARYATVFADDPGSSVLTLSSLGMVERSRLKESLHEHSRAISLWREPGGSPIELHLPKDSQALVVSLAAKAGFERTLDGRHDDEMAVVMRLAEVNAISWH